MLVSHVVLVLMSAQWAQFLRVTFTLLMLTCVQSAALVQMYAQVRQSQKDNSNFWLKTKSSSLRLRIFFVYLQKNVT